MKHDSKQNSLDRTGRQGSVALQFFAIAMLTFVSSGATCIPRRSIPDFQPTPVFDAPPTLEQLAEVVNRTRNIQSLQSNSVNVTLNNERSVNANMTWARPKKFRMTASVAGIAGFDLGSNEEVFWMTVRNFATTPDMYFARHDEFDAQRDRRILPVSPVWLMEALGITDIDLNQPLQTVKRADGLVELKSYVPSLIGNYTRIIAVDPKYGFTKQVFVFDPTERLVANANQSKHQFYPSVQSSLPHEVKVQLIPMGGDQLMELDISIGAYVVNGLSPDSMTQFTMPDTRSFRTSDLARLNQGNPQATEPPAVAPPRPSYPQNSFRGVPWDGSLYR
ncbi:MAG: hypothetical protein ABL921_06065 [Pirellula sp.]